jgi:hypothetical protein
METGNPTIINTSKKENPYYIKPPGELDQSTKSLLLKVLFSMVFTAIGFGLLGFYLGMNYSAKKESADAPLDENISEEISLSETESWISYANEEIGFRLKVPQEFNLDSESQDATMVFKNEEGEPLLYVNTVKGEDAFNEYKLSCSYESETENPVNTPVPESAPPFSGDVGGFRLYNDHACFMAGEDTFMNLVNMNPEGSITAERFNLIVSTIELTPKDD